MTLHLVDAVDAEKQTVNVHYDAHIKSTDDFGMRYADGGASNGSERKRKRGGDAIVHSQVVTFVTQELTYNAAAGSD
jgi:hypothetical protein